MKKTILITGSNGMLAKQLKNELADTFSLKFLTRKVTKKNEYRWDVNKKYIDPKAIEDVNIIIHLAGAPIADKRWNKQRKQTLLSSRVDSAKLILDELKKQNKSIETYISASAIGYYGSTTSNDVFTEDSPKGNDYLSDVCNQWEQAADRFKTEKVATRVAIVRIGVILAKDEGALKKIVTPIKYGIGSGIGTGKQYMPWIHIKDLSEVFKFVVENNSIHGTFNAVSTEHITNIQLTKKIAKFIHRKIILPNIPKFIMQLLFGDMSVMLLEGSRVSSEKIINRGFSFKYNTIEAALDDIFDSKNK